MPSTTNEELLPSEYYAKGLSDRQNYTDRAERFAKLTIPSVFRDDDHSGTDSTPDNYVQSFGAIAVKNLVSKIGMTLFPPNSSAFRFTPDADGLETLSQGSDEEKQGIALLVSQSQNNVNTRLEALDTRKTIFEVLEQLTVVSSCII